MTLPDAEGDEVTLGTLWTERPVALVHLRHFGCILCRQYVAGLVKVYTDFLDVGVQLVAVGTGGRRYAREFVEKRSIPFTVLVDKYLRTHEIIGTKSGHPLGLLKPKVLASGVRAFKSGQRQGKTGPHPFVFGAAHVIEAGGELRYAWLNGDYNDNAPIEDLMGVRVPGR